MLIRALVVIACASAVTVSGQSIDSAAPAPLVVTVPAEPAASPIPPLPEGQTGDEVARLRAAADSLRAEAQRLEASACKISDESKALREEMELLENTSEKLDDAVEAVDEHARAIEDDVQFRREVNHEAVHDSSLRAVADSSPLFDSSNIAKEKMASIRMRTEAEELIMKSRELSGRMRVVEENADRKSDLADKMSDRADDLCDRAEELEKRADEILENRNPTPFALRGHRIKAGWQWSATTVPPYGDREPHILMFGGMGAEWYPLRIAGGAVSTGLEGVNIFRQVTVKGDRYALAANPFVAYTFFPAKRMDVGVALGAAVQGQFGSEQDLNSAVAPYLRLFGAAHAGRHLSIGPTLRLNYLAKGDWFTRSLHPERVLPPGAAWIDGGVSVGWCF